MRLHALERLGAIWDFSKFNTKMSRSKKIGDTDRAVLNYSDYEYTDKIQTFIESDKEHETELHLLECYNEYEREAPLNHFSDTTLNDHLYIMYKSK